MQKYGKDDAHVSASQIRIELGRKVGSIYYHKIKQTAKKLEAEGRIKINKAERGRSLYFTLA
jgi:hypothetical protein